MNLKNSMENNKDKAQESYALTQQDFDDFRNLLVAEQSFYNQMGLQFINDMAEPTAQ